jgi:hypothetical protein
MPTINAAIITETPVSNNMSAFNARIFPYRTDNKADVIAQARAYRDEIKGQAYDTTITATVVKNAATGPVWEGLTIKECVEAIKALGGPSGSFPNLCATIQAAINAADAAA